MSWYVWQLYDRDMLDEAAYLQKCGRQIKRQIWWCNKGHIWYV